MTGSAEDEESDLAVIGWQEAVALPELGSGPLIAKIDTGARSAALHADEIRIWGHGQRRKVRFKVPRSARSKRMIECELPLHDLRHVKSSNGQTELRAVISTPIEIGSHVIDAEVTLTMRSDMGAAMLIGRSSLRGTFLVDPARAFLRSKRPKPKK
ncbi:MAG: ATP-dependent zinc protease [Parvibaculaceae bacterium]